MTIEKVIEMCKNQSVPLEDIEEEVSWVWWNDLPELKKEITRLYLDMTRVGYGDSLFIAVRAERTLAFVESAEARHRLARVESEIARDSRGYDGFWK